MDVKSDIRDFVFLLQETLTSLQNLDEEEVLGTCFALNIATQQLLQVSLFGCNFVEPRIVGMLSIVKAAVEYYMYQGYGMSDENSILFLTEAIIYSMSANAVK